MPTILLEKKHQQARSCVTEKNHELIKISCWVPGFIQLFFFQGAASKATQTDFQGKTPFFLGRGRDHIFLPPSPCLVAAATIGGALARAARTSDTCGFIPLKPGTMNNDENFMTPLIRPAISWGQVEKTP